MLAIENYTVEDSDDVQGALLAKGAGSACTLKIVRAGRAHEITVTLGERPHDGR